MKKALLTIFSLIAGTITFAQTIKVQGNPTVVLGNPSYGNVLQATFPVLNTSNQSIDVKVVRKVISEVSGSENNFCWGTNCYPPTVNISSESSIPANAANTSFLADYTPNGHSGSTTIRYCFFKTSGAPDSTCVTMKFDATIDGTRKDFDLNNMIGLPTPNPANDMTVIPYTLPANTRNAKLRILNLIGGVVKEMDLERQGAAIVLTSTLPNGIYFYNLQIDGRSVSTKKLIVKHAYSFIRNSKKPISSRSGSIV